MSMIRERLILASALITLSAGLSPAQTSEVVLHNFDYMPRGGDPESVVIGDKNGNLYGTTYYGGAANLGVVYVLNAAGQQKVLHSFTGGADGKYPIAGVIRDEQGNLYGTTSDGGTVGQYIGSGIVYKLDPDGAETILHTFTGGADGGYPVAGLTRDSSGNLYGATRSGGAMRNGAVFKVDSSGNETVLYCTASLAVRMEEGPVQA